MNNSERYLVGTIPAAFLAVLGGYHPFVVGPLVVGAFVPELDARRESTHRSWLLHTFLAPALCYQLCRLLGVLQAVPEVLSVLNFVTLGMGVHFFVDYVYPSQQDHDGASWPVHPTVLSEPWGLLLLGGAWAAQWFWYLTPEFIPWLVGL